MTDRYEDDGEPLGAPRGVWRWAKWIMLFWVVVVLVSLVIGIVQYAF